MAEREWMKVEEKKGKKAIRPLPESHIHTHTKAKGRFIRLFQFL